MTGSRIARGYAVALTAFSLGVLSFFTHALAPPFIEPDPYEAVRVLVTSCVFGLSAGLGSIGLLMNALKKRR